MGAEKAIVKQILVLRDVRLFFPFDTDTDTEREKVAHGVSLGFIPFLEVKEWSRFQK